MTWHWPAEHAVDGRAGAAEAQVAFYDGNRFGSFAEALSEVGGVVMVAVLYQEQERREEDKLSKLLKEEAQHLKQPGSVR